MGDSDLITLTADIVAAHVSYNRLSAQDVPALIQAVHDALAKIEQSPLEQAPVREPAVSIRASVKPDYIVCLEDGKKFKMLKRHLQASFGMTPEQYRTKWKLPHDYPMVAPNYAEQRRGLAHKIGLGQKPAGTTPQAGANGSADTPKPVRKKLGIVAAKEAALAHLGETAKNW